MINRVPKLGHRGAVLLAALRLPGMLNVGFGGMTALEHILQSVPVTRRAE